MNILDIGVDIVEIDRIKDAIDKNDRFLYRLFTDAEGDYFETKMFKAIGTGIRNFNIKDIEVIRNSLGKPIVKTYNNLKQICIDCNILEIKVSISHSEKYAVANAIVITKE